MTATRDQRMLKLGDGLVAWLAEHEVRYHDGERCVPEALNAIAYLMHRAGVVLDVVGNIDDLDPGYRLLVDRLRDYEAIRQEHDPGDGPSGGSARLLGSDGNDE